MSRIDPGDPPWSPPFTPPTPRDPDCSDCAPHPRHLFEHCDRNVSDGQRCGCSHSRELGIKTDAR